ncbi:MAG: hypothetical protein LUG12_07595 [Erysipelotrichaceae bacterium]|nr:hypothetical protein [Erysipelotrichaceae bacterium]
MHIKVILDISETFYINGKINFIDLNDGTHQWIMNNQYDIHLDKGYIIKQETLDDILNIYTINHTNNPTIYFKGFLNVPNNTSQTKKEHYLEAHVQSGILPLLYPFMRFDIDIELTLPQGYNAVGFKKISKTFYHNAKDTVDVVFIVYRQEDLYICQNDYVTIYAQPYQDYDNLKMMAEIAKEIYINYEHYFGKLEDKHFHIVLNPRFDNGGYT